MIPAGHPDHVRYVAAADGSRLFVREYGPADAPKTLVIIHGYGEHGGRYESRLAPFLAAGFRVIVPDVRGHGRSDGGRGHVMAFDTYLDDLERILAELTTAPAKTVLFGHSHGGLISIHYALRHPGRFAALGLSSPLLRIAIIPPAWKAGAGRLLSRIAPKLSLPTEIKAEWGSHDPAVVAAYGTDPLNHHVVNTRWFTEATAAMERANAAAGNLRIPTLLVQAGDDKLVSAAASREFAAAAPNCTYDEIAGAYHELWFEPDGATHAARFAAWFIEKTEG